MKLKPYIMQSWIWRRYWLRLRLRLWLRLWLRLRRRAVLVEDLSSFIGAGPLQKTEMESQKPQRLNSAARQCNTRRPRKPLYYKTPKPQTLQFARAEHHHSEAFNIPQSPTPKTPLRRTTRQTNSEQNIRPNQFRRTSKLGILRPNSCCWACWVR